MLLQIPKCLIAPTIEKIQEKFAGVVLNVIETFYAVSSWGKQGKTVERKQRRPLLGKYNKNFTLSDKIFNNTFVDEQRMEHHYFKAIAEHKETLRMTNSFAGGLLLLQPYIEKLMTVSANAVYNTTNKLMILHPNSKTVYVQHTVLFVG